MRTLLAVFMILILHALLFLYPGLCLAYLLGIQSYVVPIGLALSYAIALISETVIQQRGLTAVFLLEQYGVITVVLTLGVIVKAVYFSNVPNVQSCYRKIADRVIGFYNLGCITRVGLLSLMVTFLVLVGPYSEVPADVWQHLENIRREKTYIDEELFLGRNLWYSLQAHIWTLSEVNFDQYFYWTSLFNTIVFLGVVYSVAKNVALDQKISEAKSNWIGAISVMFVLCFFGIGVFSYVRYYAFSPSYFCYALYMLAAGVLFNLSNSPGINKKNVLLVVVYLVCLVVAFLIHKQEALFIVLLTGMLFLWKVLENLKIALEKRVGGKYSYVFRKYFVALTIIILVIAVSIFIVIVGPDPTLGIHGRLHRDIFDLSDWSKYLHGNYVIKINSQVTSVIGYFGILTLIGALLTWRTSRIPLVLIISCLVVLVTVFNPAFNKIFLQYAGQEVLWRISYMALLPIIGSFVLVNNVSEIVDNRSIVVRQSLLVIISIVIGLFEVNRQNFGKYWYWQKFQTIKATSIGNSYVLWTDMVEFLNTIKPRRNVLTDPVTGYILASTTIHSHSRWKFHKQNYIEFNKPSYSETSFEDYVGWLFVINRRDGAPSITGTISGHWPTNIMNVTEHYTNEFIDFVRTNKKFTRIWGKRDIEIYEVR